ncbi:hypothetical protein BDR26DRAFT_860130 [Obelidium mucronatum]|nr:hypothetical protein BDR26DRAFT_860130 [Obelidium mucronatum]
MFALVRQSLRVTAPLTRAFSMLALRSTAPASINPAVNSKFSSILQPPRLSQAVANISQARGNAGTKKKKLKPVQLRNQVKVASKRKGKHYKLKNHRGALSRWLIKSPSYNRGPVFKRAQAGTSHLNRKNRSWKSRSKRQRRTSNAQQAKLLRRLIPYHRKKYMR